MRLSTLEQTYLENYLDTEKKSINREEDLKKRIFSLKEQLQEMKHTLKRKDEEIKVKDNLVRKQRFDGVDDRGQIPQRKKGSSVRKCKTF